MAVPSVIIPKPFRNMTSEEQTTHLTRIDEYINTSLPYLISRGRSINTSDRDLFHEGLLLLGAFPQYASFCITLQKVRSDYDQYIKSMAHQFDLLIKQLSDQYTVRTHDGQHVVIIQQSQLLRRGRPTQAESDQRRRVELATAHADAISRLTGARVSTPDPAPISDRVSDTSRRHKDNEPSLFDAIVSTSDSESPAPEQHCSGSPSPTSPTPAPEQHCSGSLPPSDVASSTPDAQSSPSLQSLRFWIPILPSDIASDVRSIRDIRAELSSESERAKIIFEQGGEISDIEPHTHRAKQLHTQLMQIYRDVDEYLAYIYVMLTEVNKEWNSIPDKYLKATDECFEKLIGRLKPYAVKMSASSDSWFDNTLASARQAEAARVAKESRDPEKEKEMHKMDAYIRRSDLAHTERHLNKMRDYRNRLADMGADADSLAAYDVFIAAEAKLVAESTK